MKVCLNNKILLLFLGFFTCIMLSSCACKKSNSLSFKELISMDSISNGEFGARINLFFKLPEYLYYEMISDKKEIYRIIKESTEESFGRDFLFLNYQHFSFEKLSKTEMQVFYKDTLLVILNGEDYCNKPYQNGRIWNNVLFFDKKGKSILDREDLQKEFRQSLKLIYQNNTNDYKPTVVFDKTEYSQRYILEYTNNIGLKSFCEDTNIDMLCFKEDIENLCEVFFEKHQLSRILFDFIVFEKKENVSCYRV